MMTVVRPITAVLLVEDDPATVADTRRVLAMLPDVQILVAATLQDARRQLRRHHVELAIVDIGLPDGSGLTFVRELAADAPRDGRQPALCIVHTVFDDDAQVVAAMAAGAQGYLVKGESIPVLQERLQAALRGEPVVSPVIARRLLQEFVGQGQRRLAPTPDDETALTARERDVLQQIARGSTVAEVARALSVSENTVKSHLKNIYAKLGVQTRVRALNVARERGLIER